MIFSLHDSTIIYWFCIDPLYIEAKIHVHMLQRMQVQVHRCSEVFIFLKCSALTSYIRRFPSKGGEKNDVQYIFCTFSMVITEEHSRCSYHYHSIFRCGKNALARIKARYLPTMMFPFFFLPRTWYISIVDHLKYICKAVSFPTMSHEIYGICIYRKCVQCVWMARRVRT